MNKLTLILLIAFLSCLASVQKMASTDSLNSLVQAERSFSKASVEQGIRAAFLTFLADDAIVFRPQPVKGKPVYEQSQPIPGTLSWQPIHADIAASGDFGYTTGPYEYRKNPDSEKPDGCGCYVSVWQKQSDGNWRVMIDAGIKCPCSDTAFPEIPLDEQRHNRVYTNISPVEVDTEKARLIELELKFSSRAASDGIAHAYRFYSTDDIRYYRLGELPTLGKEPVVKKVDDRSGPLVWKPSASTVAKSGDLGYTYGLAYGTSENGLQQTNSYLRIWKKISVNDWRIVLDLMNPMPEETAH